MSFACLIDGPDWWADPSLDIDGHPLVTAPEDDRKARRIAAMLEREALLAAIEALPDDCLVLYTGGRGAGFLAGTFAAAAEMPVASWPQFPGPDGISRRNLALVAALVGLREHGWQVKAIVTEGGSDQHELMDLLASHRVFVRAVSHLDAPSLAVQEDETAVE